MRPGARGGEAHCGGLASRPADCSSATSLCITDACLPEERGRRGQLLHTPVWATRLPVLRQAATRHCNGEAAAASPCLSLFSAKERRTWVDAHVQSCPLGDVRVRLEGDCLEGVVGGDVLQQLRLCGRQAEPRVSGRGGERE